MSIDQNTVNDVIGQTVYGSDGQKIGEVGQVYLDDVTGKPEWVTVRTGLFGTKESFVPISGSDLTSDGLQVSFDKDTVKAAPRVDTDQGHLSEEEESDLYRHYGFDDANTVGTNPVAGLKDADQPYDQFADEKGIVGHDTSGPTTDDAMTRSEEQLKVGTATREAGRARLRKYVVTEEQTVTVPVTREEVRLERVPITETDAATMSKAMDGPDISEEEHEIVLHEEQIVVEKKAVPVERVKLAKETVTEQQTVTEQVRKEQIETDLDGDGKADTIADPRR